MSYWLGSRKHLIRPLLVFPFSVGWRITSVSKNGLYSSRSTSVSFHFALWVTCVSRLLGLHLVNVCLYVLRPRAVIDSSHDPVRPFGGIVAFDVKEERKASEPSSSGAS